MAKVWLYAYALQVTSSRRLEQRVKEDLAFRYLAGVAKPDHWTLNDFRTRHRRAINDVFLQVVEVARGLGMGKLGHVAIDSTRVKANASTRRMETKQELRHGPGRDLRFGAGSNSAMRRTRTKSRERRWTRATARSWRSSCKRCSRNCGS